MTTIDSSALALVNGGDLIDRLGKPGGFAKIVPGPSRASFAIYSAVSLGARALGSVLVGSLAGHALHDINQSGRERAGER